MTFKIFANTALLALFSVGCSDSSGNIESNFGQCEPTQREDFAACGGDLTGTWTFDSVCTETEPFNAEGGLEDCDEAVIQDASFFANASVVFSQGKLFYTGELNTDLNAFLPFTCFEEGAGQTCEVENNDDDETIECRPASGGCQCNLQQSVPVEAQVDYETIGNRIEFVTPVPFGVFAWDDGDYCVSGNVLELRLSTSIIRLTRP